MNRCFNSEETPCSVGCKKGANDFGPSSRYDKGSAVQSYSLKIVNLGITIRFNILYGSLQEQLLPAYFLAFICIAS